MIDRREKLKENPFSYTVTKAQKAMLYYEGRQIMMLSEKDTKKFISKINGKSGVEEQLVLAKVTGNFKHGNEKLAKRKRG